MPLQKPECQKWNNALFPKTDSTLYQCKNNNRSKMFPGKLGDKVRSEGTQCASVC